ncbi:guanylate kinase, partial [Thermus scotoductus]
DWPEKIEMGRKQGEWGIESAHLLDYVVVNGGLEEAVADFLAILTAERRRTPRRGPAVERAWKRDKDLEAELDEILRRSYGGSAITPP